MNCPLCKLPMSICGSCKKDHFVCDAPNDCTKEEGCRNLFTVKGEEFLIKS